jgi:hypothetical protein
LRIGLTDGIYYLIGQVSFIGIIGSVEGFREVISGGGMGTKGWWWGDGGVPEI